MKTESFDDYVKSNALSATVLKALQKSVAHAVEASKYSSDKSSAMKFGSALHESILEPEKFKANYTVLAEKLDRRKTADKEKWAKLVDTYGEDNILTTDEDFKLRQVKRSIRQNQSVAKILSQVDITEKSLYWDENGIECKARLDAYSHKLKAVIDLKTTNDASPQGFSRAIFKYGYHLQASHYLTGARQNDMPVDKFIFIALETEPPFLCMAYVLGNETLMASHIYRSDLLPIWKKYLDDSIITGYSDKVEQIDIPQYAFSLIEKTQE